MTKPNPTTTFLYDGDGGRVRKTRLDTGESTVYIGSLYEVSGSLITKHIFSGANRICTATTYGVAAGLPVGEVGYAYYHSDHLGSSNIITDSQGQQIANYEYTPYGGFSKSQLANGQTGKPANYYFTGKELDSSTDLYYYGARYYDYALGRFITPDTIVQAPYDP
jgi:RHS repeat-associated protein